MVREYVDAADIGQAVVFRVTSFRPTMCKTLMLENGADVRFSFKRCLDMRRLETTQIYTPVLDPQTERDSRGDHPAKMNPGRNRTALPARPTAASDPSESHRHAENAIVKRNRHAGANSTECIER